MRGYLAPPAWRGEAAARAMEVVRRIGSMCWTIMLGFAVWRIGELPSWGVCAVIFVFAVASVWPAGRR